MNGRKNPAKRRSKTRLTRKADKQSDTPSADEALGVIFLMLHGLLLNEELSILSPQGKGKPSVQVMNDIAAPTLVTLQQDCPLRLCPRSGISCQEFLTQLLSISQIALIEQN